MRELSFRVATRIVIQNLEDPKQHVTIVSVNRLSSCRMNLSRKPTPHTPKTVFADHVGSSLLGLAFALLAMAASAASEIEFGYPDQSIFATWHDAQGRQDSPTLRLAATLLDRIGMPWHASSYPAPRLFRNLQAGATDFSILVRSPALEACCLISKRPVIGTTLNVYSLGKNPSVKRREQLIGHSVITIRGYTYSGLLGYIKDPANRIRNEVAATHKAAFDMLAANRAEYLIDYASAAGDQLAVRSLNGIRIETLEKVDVYLALSKTYPDADRLMLRLETVAATIDIERIRSATEKR